MAYKDPEKAREKRREWRAANRESLRKKKHEWYLANKERCLETHKRWQEANKEQATARRRARYAEEHGGNVRRYRRRNEMQEKMESARCPKCGNPCAVKVSGMYYLAGCSKPGCKYFVGRDPEHGFAATGTTREEAVAGWNELARELREELGDRSQESGARSQGGEVAEEEEARLEAGAPEEVEDTRLEAAAPEEEPEAGEEAVEEEAGEESDGEEEEEPEQPARYWLELDGSWYRLEEGMDGCDGCAFRLMFGSRVVCAAIGSADFAQAAELCKTLCGVWHRR